MQTVTNDAALHIETSIPYTVELTIKGEAPLLLHAWSNEDVAEKAKAKKGSATKKTDNLESYIRRNEEGVICLPGEYLRQSLVIAAKSHQDPRSPRKSLMDLAKASLVCLDDLMPINSAVNGEEAMLWDYIDQRRVVIQRAAITRQRPAFKAGWQVTGRMMVLTPDYIDESLLYKLATDAGRFCGVGDFRPTFGRFMVTRFERIHI